MNIIKENFVYFVVYKTTNLLNGKKYIGMHSTNNINDSYLGSGVLLRKAIGKYGSKNFAKEILFVFDNFDDMAAKEAELVTEDTICDIMYYNLKAGGEGGVYSEEVKNKIAIKATGRKMSKESIEKGLKTRKANGTWYKTGIEHHLYGKGIPEESVQQMKASLNKRYATDLEVWNKGMRIKDIESDEERKKYGRNMGEELNPSHGSKWLGNINLSVKCYIKKGDTELESLLKENGWIEKPPGFNSLKSVTKSIKEYL